MSLVPVPSDEDRPACPNCSAPLTSDQRYCLACGKPVSPVRLGFLDVLQSENPAYPGPPAPVGAFAPAYAPAAEPSSGAYSWLRRYSGLFGLLAVLLLAIIVGLLVGHWVTQNKAPGTSVVKVEGLPSVAPAAAASTPGAAAPATTAPKTTAPSATPPAATIATSPKAEAKEAKEAKAIEKTPPPKPVKVTPAKLQKLGNSTGKKHEEEVSKLGAEPIETG
jgi:hypothetical protein